MIALPVKAKFTTSIYDANGGTLATVYAAGPGDDVKAKRDEIIQALNLHDELVAALWHAERHCPCGARPESSHTHPHVIGCPIGTVLAKLKGA